MHMYSHTLFRSSGKKEAEKQEMATRNFHRISTWKTIIIHYLRIQTLSIYNTNMVPEK
jgi:hypothetical protein